MTTDPVFYDLETQSLYDLREVGGYRYAYAPSTSLLCMVVWIDGVYHLWTCGRAISPVLWPKDLPVETFVHHTGADMPGPIVAAVRAGRTFIAHNGDEFDQHVWEAKLTPVPTSWGDTLPLARCGGYPGKLDLLSKLFLGVGKSETAQNALMRICKPDKKGRLVCGPGDLSLVASYNIADVAALRRIYEKVHRFTDPVYPVHRVINQRGIGFDAELAAKIIAVSRENIHAAATEIEELTGGFLKFDNLTKRNKVLEWVKRQGVFLVNSQGKETLRREDIELFISDPEAYMEQEGDDGDYLDE